jgi:hypothetical protein
VDRKQWDAGLGDVVGDELVEYDDWPGLVMDADGRISGGAYVADRLGTP